MPSRADGFAGRFEVVRFKDEMASFVTEELYESHARGTDDGHKTCGSQRWPLHSTTGPDDVVIRALPRVKKREKAATSGIATGW